jgi:hypothetical protein
MKKLSLVAALLAIAIAVPLSLGSSHREAPLTSIDPTADDTDVYAYTAKNDPSTSQNEEKYLTVVANWIPFEDPAGGPNFYRFDDRADYYINIDNDGDGRHDIRYLFKFKTKTLDKNSFLYAQPTVDSIDDPDLNVQQTYSIDREVFDHPSGGKQSRRGRGHGKGRHRNHRGPHNGRHGHRGHRGHNGHKRHKRAHGSHAPNTSRIATDLPVAPNNVGPKTMPDYGKLADQAIETLNDGTKVFVGQRDDPFFVDLGATFDSINFRKSVGDQGEGKDDLAGYSVHSIVLQVPERRITRDREFASGPDDKSGVVGVWSSTERQKLQVTDNGDERGKGDDVQVSRLGNPLVNEVVIPLGQKDRFNRTEPADDAENYGQFVLNPQLARVMNALFGLGVKETGRTDIVQALLQGIPGLNQQTGKPVDTLKVNLGTPPTASPSRFGVLASDLAGFPNGRRLTDDVVDIELRVVEGILLDPPDKRSFPLGDGVDQNDKAFLDHFPYVAAPTSGFDSSLKRTEPGHPSE